MGALLKRAVVVWYEVGLGGDDEEGMITICNFGGAFVVSLLSTLFGKTIISLYLATFDNKESSSSSSLPLSSPPTPPPMSLCSITLVHPYPQCILICTGF